MLPTSPRSYPCDECGECFSSHCLLGEHTALYDKTRPHKCSYCLKRFTQKRDLYNHEKEHNMNLLPQLPEPSMYFRHI